MRVLVTGAAGRLGRATLRLLAAQGVPATGLDRVAPEEDVPVDRMVLGEVTDPDTVAGALAGVDAVAHFAAIPYPEPGRDFAVFGENSMATFVVLELAARAGIRRAVLASSHSVLGMAFSPEPLLPHYLPVDDAHPLQVVDPYALSKQADEATAEMMARRYGMTVVALRYPFLGGFGDRVPTLAESYREDPGRGARYLWAYLEDRDAATAAWLALTVPLTGYHVLSVAAPETLLARATEGLLDEYFPRVPRRRPLPGRSVPWDTTGAREVLGFIPVHHYEPFGHIGSGDPGGGLR